MNDSTRQPTTFYELLTRRPLEELSSSVLYDAAESRLDALHHLLEVLAVVDNPDQAPGEVLNRAFSGLAMLAQDAHYLYAGAMPNGSARNGPAPGR